MKKCKKLNHAFIELSQLRTDPDPAKNRAYYNIPKLLLKYHIKLITFYDLYKFGIYTLHFQFTHLRRKKVKGQLTWLQT